MELDIEAIRQSPRQFVDLETVIALSDRCMVLALQADEVNAARIYLREKGRLLTELAEKNAEIERLERLADAIDKRAGERIAASQARELQLREALEVAGRNMDTGHEYDRERDDLSCAVFRGGECDCHVGVVNEALRAGPRPAPRHRRPRSPDR